MIISISGNHGSGKSTIAQMLADELSWPRYYMGGLRRQAARKMGLTLAEYNKLGESDPQTDLAVDKYQEELGRTKDNFIIEGRTSWYFIPHSLKIYLDVDDHEAAKRILQDVKQKSGQKSRNEADGLNSVEDVLRSLKERKRSDKKRYKKYFNINPYLKKHYDFYLDTSDLSLKQVFKAVLGFVRSHIDKK
ncbi:MAG: cytidylate kinase family protein [Patescibacteria group bacterium]